MNLKVNQKKKADKKKKVEKKSKFREYTDAIIFAVIAATILRIFVIQAFRIPTGSMEDSLLVGDFLLVNKFIYGVRTPDKIPLINVKIPWVRLPGFKKPKKGDVVVFKYPRNPDQDYIKRCVAVGGDTIVIRNKQLYINGKIFENPPKLKYVDPSIYPPGQKSYDIEPSGAGNRDNYGPIVVPDKHYFMMGDNRDNSLDSRYWGFLPEENVVGEALILYFSWDKTVPFFKLFKKIRWGRIGNLIK